MTAADRVAAICLLLFGVFVIVEARGLPYWTVSAPGPGFLPFWLGVLLVCASALLFARTLATIGKATGGTSEAEVAAELVDRATAIRLAVVVGFTVGAAVLSLLVGLVLASGVFMAATLAYLRPGHARANWIASLVTPAALWLLFVRWLGVPLPPGRFGF